MASKQTYTVPVKLSEDLLRRLIYVSRAEGRTPNNQFTFMLRNNIQYFERTKGKIPASELAKIDITPYMDVVVPADEKPESNSES